MNDLPLEKALQIAGYGNLVKTAGANGETYCFDTREATIVSSIKAQVKHASAEVQQRCADHANFWGVSDKVQLALDKIAAHKPAELEDQHYALRQEHNGQPVRKYAAFDGYSTVEAATAFTRHAANYPLTWRKQAAVNLLERAQRYGQTLPEFVDTYLHKAAGFGYSTPEALERLIDQRYGMTGDHKLAEALQPLLEDRSLLMDGQIMKTAVEALNAFDIEHGLTEKYGGEVDLPEELVDSNYTVTALNKIAGITKCAVQLVNGRTVDVSLLSKEALEAVDPNLAKLAEDELIAVLPTLPKPDADLLIRVA